MRNESPFQALRRHNKVYKGINKARQATTRYGEERIARLERNAKALESAVRNGAPETAIVYFASLVRHDAEALGITIRLGK